DAQLTTQVGIAKREDILALLGEPDVKDSIGDLEVWIYRFESPRKGGITAMFKAAAPHFDEILMTFSPEGILQKYTAILRGQKGKGKKQGP
ncbi:MAG TPA: hypothetical protein VEN81_02050, partial [Planctomycetota bacterium]|nr:hypothetical protein [Planctomycetota bacterium]